MLNCQAKWNGQIEGRKQTKSNDETDYGWIEVKVDESDTGKIRE